MKKLKELGLVELHLGDPDNRVWLTYKGKTAITVTLARGTTTFHIKVSKNGKDQDFVRHSEDETFVLLCALLNKEVLQIYVLCGFVILCALGYAVAVLLS